MGQIQETRRDTAMVSTASITLLCTADIITHVHLASYPGPKKGLVSTVCACADTPLFCGASETTVIWSVFHDCTLLKHVGCYILVENDGGQFWENCVWTRRVVRPQ